MCGSVVRGEETGSSDIDVLVSYSDTPDLLEFVNLKRYLTSLIGREVDMGMATALKEERAANTIHRDVQSEDVIEAAEAMLPTCTARRLLWGTRKGTFQPMAMRPASPCRTVQTYAEPA